MLRTDLDIESEYSVTLAEAVNYNSDMLLHQRMIQEQLVRQCNELADELHQAKSKVEANDSHMKMLWEHRWTISVMMFVVFGKKVRR